MKLLLGSGSPRRKELLENLGYPFEVVKIDCDEIYPLDLKPEKIAEYLSELKANAYPKILENEILLTADTVVILENEVLGKPKNELEAKVMLQKLSGKMHEVYTGISFKTFTGITSFTDVAKVYCKELTHTEINYYIKKNLPLDKAGSYGIQEWLGMAKIHKIEGSFYTIMGLPTHLVYEFFKDLNIANH